MMECDFVNSTRIICNEITINSSITDVGFWFVPIVLFAILGYIYIKAKKK